MLWLLQWYPNFWLLAGFVVCFGSMIGSRGPLLTATAMKIFRGERVGTIYGTISIGSGLGSAIGSWGGGLIHDWTHSYNPVDRVRACQRCARDDPVSGGARAAPLNRTACLPAKQFPLLKPVGMRHPLGKWRTVAMPAAGARSRPGRQRSKQRRCGQ